MFTEEIRPLEPSTIQQKAMSKDTDCQGTLEKRSAPFTLSAAATVQPTRLGLELEGPRQPTSSTAPLTSPEQP